MSHAADQEMEKEAIRAIYPEGFVDLAPYEYIFQFPVPGFGDAFIRLHIQYPPEYPEAPANICSCEAINLHQSASSKVIQAINSRHMELAGEPYIAALSMLVEDALGLQTDEDTEACPTPSAANLPSEEEFNPGLLPGPPLTAENFKEWWTTFCVENNISLEDVDEQCARPTGRQIWEEMERGGAPMTTV
ncbi:RWD domain-containing protein [Giardia duodenalis]|uniref:RWD domain-containing protein n=1 Tax=Giardia intestinalis (strain ATCC 50803 / WB clone C6) TaxID=184922 RepID=A0A644F0H5_GIAIC|nr:RWD domain-containing protein [Giardia intestinalis]KAE8302148.1 RWD domain-containing protein [Giardia intestinalis]